jgi:hypothetical protein
MRILLLAHVTLFAASGPLRAREPSVSYFMAVFAAQVDSNDPSLTHSFATFIRATAPSDSAKDVRVDVHTISWMPQSLNILLLQTSPEPGANLDLKTSLRWAESRNCRVSMWGPYKIEKELFDRAVAQELRLKSGRVQYKAVDRHFRPGVASNCIHAVSDLDNRNGLMDSGQLSGDAASRQIVQHLDHWIVDHGQSNAWMARRLGLKVDSVNPRDPEQRLVLISR